MIKRVGFIAALTGVGQLVSIFAIKYASQRLPTEKMNALAQIEALIMLLLNVIAFGLQSSAMRNIALEKEWHSEFQRTQSARLMLSLFISLMGFLTFLKWEYCIFFFAPVLALSGDYALYAIGQPVKGAIIGCIRLIIPYSLLLVTVYLTPGTAIYIFIMSWAGVYFFTNLVISKQLKTNNLVNPFWKDLNLYLKSIPLGIASISFYFLGIGLLLVLPYFYAPIVVTVAFVGFKFYVIFKGTLRIIHQAFLKEMVSDKWCLKVDELSMLIGLALAGSVILFPDSFISFFLAGNTPAKKFFMLLGVSALIYSLLLSSATKALLEKKDRPYTIAILAAALMAISCSVIFSMFYPTAVTVGMSICVGEITLFAGLIFLTSNKTLILNRLRFLLLNSLLLLIPLCVRYNFKDNLMWYIVSFGIFSLALILIHRNNFSLLTKH